MGRLMSKLALAVFLVFAMTGFTFAAGNVFKIATHGGYKGTPMGDDIKRLGELIEKNSNGRLETKVFYSEELGGQLEVMDLFVEGDIDMMINDTITTYSKKMIVITTPYIIKDWDDARKAYAPDGWLFDIVSDVYAEIGLKFFGPWAEGFMGVGTKGKFALTEEEASKMKIRVPPISPVPEIVSAFGYKTATIEWGEVVTSLQTGVVDGDGGNNLYWDYFAFGDELDYYLRHKSNFIAAGITMNMEKFNALSAEDKKVVEDAALLVSRERFVAAEMRDSLTDVNAALAKGVTIILPSDELIKGYAEKVRAKVWPVIEKKVGKEIMDKVRANAAKY